MHAVIIDDERYSVKAIMENIHWETIGENGVEVKGAYNVEQAKMIIEQGEVDFIICDIEMPRSNGIDLIKWIRQEGYPIEAIIVTCHEEFQYAKEAITLNVYDYCVKPLDYIQMENIVKNLVQKIVAGKREKKQSGLGQYYIENKTELERIFWQRIIEGNYAGNEGGMIEEASRIGLGQVLQEEFNLALICVKQFNVHLASWNQDKLMLSVSNVAKGVFGQRMESGRILMVKSDIIVISQDEGFDWLLEKCGEMSKLCQEMIHVKVCCYVGENVSYEKLHESYQRLKMMAYGDISHLEGVFVEDVCERAIEVLPMDIPAEIQKLLEYAKYDEFVERFRVWVSNIQKEDFDLRALQSLQENLIQVIYSHLMKLGISARMLLQEEELKKKYELINISVENAIQWMDAVFKKINSIMENRRNSGNAAVMDMKKFIELHLTEDVTREEIAKAVHLNVDYAARIFKQEEGISIMDFLGKRRIIKAISLMQTTDMSISDVAYHSGFINSSHFSTLFKKTTGISPREFRSRDGG